MKLQIKNDHIGSDRIKISADDDQLDSGNASQKFNYMAISAAGRFDICNE